MSYVLAKQYIEDDTDRPELVDEIKRRIQRAVMTLHRIDFWKKDLVEQLYIFQASQAVQVIQKRMFPRFRAVGYLRKYNADSASLFDPNVFQGAVGSFFKEVNPQQALDGYGYDRRDSFYESGDTLKINSSEEISQVLIGWFKDPMIEPIEASDSWILTGYPALIAAQAKRRIFKDIGKDQEAKSAQDEFNEELMILQANNVRCAVLQQPG